MKAQPCKSGAQKSGKLLIRIPKNLHAVLAKQAQNEGVSLNQYILTLLSFRAGQKVGM